MYYKLNAYENYCEVKDYFIIKIFSAIPSLYCRNNGCVSDKAG